MSSVLTIAEAAEDLRTSEALVWSYHRRGLLAVMYLKNVGAAPSRRGPRDARIDRAEWERFKQFLTVRCDTPTQETPADDRPRPGRPRKGIAPPAGSDKYLRGYKAARSKG